MKKQKHETDYAAALEESYARWAHLYEYGGSDPFYEDGVNLNLVRNHIVYYKQMLEKENSLFGLPDAYYRELPPEVDIRYMARPDEIRANALIVMQRIDEDENLAFIREQSRNLNEKQLKQLCVTAVIGYAENLRTAIAEDDLVTMRRYEHPDHYLDAFRSLAEKLGSANAIDRIETVSYEDNEDEDYECCEDEQAEPAAAPEKPQEYIQLTLF